MKVTINKADVSINLIELVEHLTPEVRSELAMVLAADHKIIEAAVASVMGEWFFEDSGGWWNHLHRKLQAKLIPLMPEAAKRLIAELLCEVQRAEKEQRRAEEWAWRMYHAWPDRDGSNWQSCPLIGAFEPSPQWRDKQLEAEQRLAEGK